MMSNYHVRVYIVDLKASINVANPCKSGESTPLVSRHILLYLSPRAGGRPLEGLASLERSPLPSQESRVPQGNLMSQNQY